eukprot:gnl/Chilomastix_cuspidata/787.p1 GENE.gnl/Chilomastix_cuspidata/787~~gnl/Chilomastix_cuspidata/787.p1  ORF type:complete len:837 (+),score=290.17 gnl/Chilomastix_cuspidata/787:1081-3591(+)
MLTAGGNLTACRPFLSSDLQHLFAASRQEILAFSTQTFQKEFAIPFRRRSIMGIYPIPHTNTQILSVTDDSKIQIWNVDTQALLREHDVRGHIELVKMHPDNDDKLLILFLEQGNAPRRMLRLAQLSLGKGTLTNMFCVRVPPFSGAPALEVHAQHVFVGAGSLLFARSLISPDLFVYTLSRGVQLIAGRPGAPQLAVATRHGVIRIFRDEFFSSGRRIALPSDPDAFAPLPKKSEIAHLDRVPHTSLSWHSTAPRVLQFTRDGTSLVSGGDETVLVLWSTATGKPSFIPRVGSGIVGLAMPDQPPRRVRVAVSARAPAVVALANNTIQVWDLASKKCLKSVVGLPTAAGELRRYAPLDTAWPAVCGIPLGAAQREHALVVGSSVGRLSVFPAEPRARVSPFQDLDIEARSVNVMSLPERTSAASRVKASAVCGPRANLVTISGVPAAALNRLDADGISGLCAEEVLRVFDLEAKPNAAAGLSAAETDTAFSSPRMFASRARKGTSFELAAYCRMPHGAPVTCLCAAPRASRFVTCARDGEVKVWAQTEGDARGWGCASSASLGAVQPVAAALSADGELLVVVSERADPLADARGGAERARTQCYLHVMGTAPVALVATIPLPSHTAGAEAPRSVVVVESAADPLLAVVCVPSIASIVSLTRRAVLSTLTPKDAGATGTFLGVAADELVALVSHQASGGKGKHRTGVCTVFDGQLEQLAVRPLPFAPKGAIVLGADVWVLGEGTADRFFTKCWPEQKADNEEPTERAAEAAGARQALFAAVDAAPASEEMEVDVEPERNVPAAARLFEFIDSHKLPPPAEIANRLIAAVLEASSGV